MTRQPWIFIAIVLAASIAAPDVLAQNLTCGIKPIPAIGCRIGRCVDGVCAYSDDRDRSFRGS